MNERPVTLEEALALLKKLHEMYEHHGDAMSRYAHEVRAILRRAGQIPYPDGHIEAAK